MNAFVSIILDNYNYAAYLPQALACVAAQTYRHFELILVDDGSTDESRDILRCFAAGHMADFPIKTVLQENAGQSAAFNAGFALCEGDIVCFLDSDDVWFPDKLEKVVRAHQCLTQKIVRHIVHHVETTDPASNPALFEYASPPRPKPHARVRTGIDWHTALIRHGYMCHHSSCSSMSFSRAILSRIFPLTHTESMRFCTDTVLFTCCLSLTTMYKLDEVLSYYRIHEHNIYAGKYSGERDRQLTETIRLYCNEQLASKGLPAVPFHPTRYFEHLLTDFASTKPVIIYGTASAGDAFYSILAGKGIFAEAFADSDPSKHGRFHLGLPVVSPPEIKSRGALALIASWASRDITEYLNTFDLREKEDYMLFDI